MVSLQQSLGIRFEDSRAALEGVASEFRNVGDETESAAHIFDTFGKALQNTGISAKASVDIVSQMIKGLGELNVGTKAFLSTQSGGPGGLQGSLQIDEMFRKKDLAGVMNIAQNALKQQMGGSIYTQQEGAEQGGAVAYQYQKERSMLQSGIFGIGKGTDDQTAGRIIEALKQGNVSGLTDIMKTGQSAAGDLAEKGNAIQERNYQVFTDMARELQANTIATQIGSAGIMRMAFGSGASKGQIDNMMANYHEAEASLKQKQHPTEYMGKEAYAPEAEATATSRLRGHSGEHMEESLKAMKDGTKLAMEKLGLIKPTEETPSTAPTIPMHPATDHGKAVLGHAMAGAGHQATTTHAQPAIAAAQQQSQEQTVKVMIEVKDPGNMVKVTSTGKASINKTHNGNMNPEQPSSDPGY